MNTGTLTSANNPLLKTVRRAVARGGATDDGACVAEGFHLLEEALRSGCRIDAVLLAADTRLDVPLPEKVRIHLVSREAFQSVASTDTTQGVIALVHPPRWTVEHVAGPEALVVVVDGVQDPGNAGAMIRTAEAFGATGVLFLKGTANVHNPKSLRASAGSVFRMPYVAGVSDDALRGLVAERALTFYSTASSGGLNVGKADLRKPCAIAIGSEGRGVRSELACDAVAISIPTRGVESLNAAVAAGVILYEAQRQRSAS